MIALLSAFLIALLTALLNALLSGLLCASLGFSLKKSLELSLGRLSSQTLFGSDRSPRSHDDPTHRHFLKGKTSNPHTIFSM